MTAKRPSIFSVFGAWLYAAGLAAALLPAAPVPAGAFLFGGNSDKKAGELLGGMRSSFERGDCEAVIGKYGDFSGEKPPAEMREEAYGYLGRCYEASGSTDKAIGLYKLALGLYPENSLFAYRLALIYNKDGFPGNAAPLFAKVLSVYPDDIGANIGLARAYASLGFLARAGDSYSRAVILQDFKDGPVLKEYAFCMLKKRDWNEALFAAGKGAQASPGLPAWPLVEARVRAGRGEYYKAIAAMEAAIRLEPSRLLRLERALYLLLGGLPRRAIEAADAELLLDKADPLASLVKGMSLYTLKDKTGAAEYFSRAESGGPFTARIAASFGGGQQKRTEDSCGK